MRCSCTGKFRLPARRIKDDGAERLGYIRDDTPMAPLLLSVMGAFAEFEHALIRERQAEGIALAKQRGVYQGGRPRALTDEAVAAVRQRMAAGESQAAIARELRVHRTTLSHYLRDDASARGS